MEHNRVFLSRTAQGKSMADVVLKNARVINVFSEEIISADIAITDSIIVGVGEYHGNQEIDMHGRYIAPGFIDSHLHLESTLVTPHQLVHQAALRGTTTFIVDPHESANVSGLRGIKYILQQTENVKANVFVMIPSCVPATKWDDNGAEITAEKMKALLKDPRIIGLGEVMDYVSVVNGEPSMQDKLNLFAAQVKDGHAPFLSDGDLSAYCLAGIATDHECIDFDYAMKERRNGMQILIREGSAAKNLEAIVKGIVVSGMDTSGFCFCTDDKHIEDIRNQGHIDYCIKKAISLGLPPLKAIKMATIQAAQCYGLKGLGGIAPGYQADLVVINSLTEMNIEEVYYKGKLIESTEEKAIYPVPNSLLHTIHMKKVFPTMLCLKKEKNKQHVIEVIEGQITTRDVLEEIPGEDYFQADSIYNKIAVCERHHNTGQIGIAPLKGFHIQNGAIASSVSHDSHNIIAVGDNDEDICIAINAIRKLQGGYIIVENGKIFESLPLPIMGLISNLGYKEINEKLNRMIKKAHRMGVSNQIAPFITLSFMALPVIPELRILPRGLFQVKEQKLL